MSQKYLIRIAELESQLRQKDQQLSLVEETEAFLRSALALHPAMPQRKIRPCHGDSDIVSGMEVGTLWLHAAQV